MILAAGLTPAWQQIMRFASVRRGEVNRAAEVYWCASGKVLNVGMALATLGVDSHTLSPASGWSGTALEADFARRGARATWIATERPTRVCTTLLNDGDGTTTELVENASALTSTELTMFIDAYAQLVQRANVVVLTGSLPLGTPTTFYRDLLAKTQCPVVLDARGPELLEALGLKPRVVKPNREELGMTIGRALTDRASVVEAMRELVARGAQSVVVTRGREAVLVMEGSQLTELTPIPVAQVVNPIGCGDCLAAGVAWGLSRADSLVDAVRLGMAAAAENLTQLLPAQLDPARVRSHYEKMRCIR